MQNVKQKLESTFRCIDRERMRDMPMCNSALEVAAIGFDEGETVCLGVLLTPWCMNLVLLPRGEDWRELKLGSKQVHCLPSGEYEFVVAEEAGLGRYQSCSLFSPMFEFADQATAQATAEAALAAVMKRDEASEASLEKKMAELAPRELSRRDLLRGGRL